MYRLSAFSREQLDNIIVICTNTESNIINKHIFIQNLQHSIECAKMNGSLLFVVFIVFILAYLTYY